MTDADIVYNGTWSLPATLTTVINVAIDLTKSFEYTGGDLLLCIYDKTGTAMTDNPNQFYCTKNAEQVNRTLFCVNESSPIDMSALSSLGGSRYKYTNNIEFTFANGKTAGRYFTMSFENLPEVLSYMNEYKAMYY